jgi:hypothetical protein
MPQTYLPRQTAPVERTIAGTPATDTATVDQSFAAWPPYMPFAGDGDE